MKIYVVMKTALSEHGTATRGSTEAAFVDPLKATAYLNGKQVVWQEQGEGQLWYCERGVHEIELEGI